MNVHRCVSILLTSYHLTSVKCGCSCLAASEVLGEGRIVRQTDTQLNHTCKMVSKAFFCLIIHLNFIY